MQGQKEICKGKFERKKDRGEERKEKKVASFYFSQVYGFLLAVGLELVWEIIGKENSIQ